MLGSSRIFPALPKSPPIKGQSTSGDCLPHQSDGKILSMITLTDISSAVCHVLPRYDVREAYLFGSFARGEQTSDSDIDLRLVCGHTMTFGALYELSLELEEELGRKVNFVTNPPDNMRPAFRKNIEQDEVRLYQAA